MITRTDWERVSTFDAGQHFVLSVQLGMGPDTRISRSYRTVFNSLVHVAEAKANNDQHHALRREAERVHDYLIGMTPRGQGLLLYACSPLDFWEVFVLPQPVPDEFSIDRRPRLLPLHRAFTTMDRIGIVVIDGEEARIMAIEQNACDHLWAVVDLIPGRHRQGGWSQANFARHRERLIDGHIESIITRLTEIDAQQPFAHIVLGGPQEIVTRARESLPGQLHSRLAGTFPIEMFAPDDEIIERAMVIVRTTVDQDERALIDALLDRHPDEGRVALGLDATLGAIADGRVRMLLIAGAGRVAGSMCASCGRLAGAAADACPVCGASLVPIDDVIELALRRALEYGSGVRFISGDAALRLSERSGAIAALLRY